MQGIIGTTYLVRLFLVKNIKAITKIKIEIEINIDNGLFTLSALKKPRKLTIITG